MQAQSESRGIIIIIILTANGQSPGAVVITHVHEYEIRI
jgi:hypothetical protein